MRTAREQGSVFIEALVALAVVAMMLGGLFQAIGASASRHRMVDQRRTALLIAQSQMSAVGVQVPLRNGRTQAVVGQLIWSVEITDGATGLPPSSAGRPALVTVSVRATDSSRPIVTLRSIRLVPPA